MDFSHFLKTLMQCMRTHTVKCYVSSSKENVKGENSIV